MGTEYYLVKPKKKEVLHLGKHFTCPFGVANRTYKNNACFIDRDNFDDFLWDFLRDNSEYFNDLKLEDIKEILYKVYKWCSGDKIYFDNDCNDEAEWIDWKESSSLEDIIKEVVSSKRKEKISSIKPYLEESKATIFESPSYETAIIGISLDERVVYDYNLMIDYLVEHNKMSISEAEEFIEYTVRALPYFPKAPVILIMDGNYE